MTQSIDDLIARLESYENRDGFNRQLAAALREQRDELEVAEDALKDRDIALNRAEAERDALRKDAERYAWLKTQVRSDPDMSGNHRWYSAFMRPVRGPTLDVAIDAAIAKEKG